MNRHTRDSLVRALCATTWCVPGLLWCAAVATAEPARGDRRWTMVLPRAEGVCGMAAREAGALPVQAAVAAAIRSGEMGDSLMAIARDPRADAGRRRAALHLFAASGDPRAERFLDAHLPALRLPTLVVPARGAR